MIHCLRIYYFSVLFLIYCPMGVLPYFSYGGQAIDNIINNLADGPLKTFCNIMVLLHLVAAFPILTNPPAQFFEGLLNIPSGTYLYVNSLTTT